MAEHTHAWIPDQMQVGLSCPDCGLVYSDWAQDEIKRLRGAHDERARENAALGESVERLEDENERLHEKRLAEQEQYDLWRRQRDDAQAENERLQQKARRDQEQIERFMEAAGQQSIQLLALRAEKERLRAALGHAITAMESCGEHPLVLATLIRPKEC